MAGPCITTLLTPNPASNNTTTDGTEQTLASSTSLSQGGVFKPVIDLTNMVDGDAIEVRGYQQANGSSSLVQAWVVSFANAQTSITPDLPVIVGLNGLGVKVTVKRVAGSDRAYQWSVANMLGT